MMKKKNIIDEEDFNLKGFKVQVEIVIITTRIPHMFPHQRMQNFLES